MRTAPLVTPWLLALSVAPAWAMAQNPPPSNAPVAESAAQQRALAHTPLPASAAIVASPQDWRAAHAAVAQFPRGHADVVRWEAAQKTASNPAAAPAATATATSQVTQGAQAAQPAAACPMMANMPTGSHGETATNTPAGTRANAPSSAHHHEGQP
ncbi:hypothetical protein [Comamonas avium]|uniref:Uncharacterized protein n=1 Tax=Comamonas avium TaxID=2762231 RepID=A0ABR8S5W4_9BURK|nr:hypothetical protein [Comamonas avium]MBD7958877.1 hypothetical protein [Comamonas avium]